MFLCHYSLITVTAFFFCSSSIDCPPCYNQIQLLVNRLRINIRKLVRIIEHFNSSSSEDLVVDRNFERRLKELREAVNKLLEKAEKSNSTDRALQQQLEVLNERVDKINGVVTDVWNNTTVTEQLIASALGNISEAEASINRSRSLLDEAENLLVDKGAKALNESILAANSTSEQATRMAEIRNEVKILRFSAEKLGRLVQQQGQPVFSTPRNVECARNTVIRQIGLRNGVFKFIFKFAVKF